MQGIEILVVVIFTVLAALLFAGLAYKFAQCRSAIRHYKKCLARTNDRLMDVVSGEETIHISKHHCDGCNK